MSTSRLSMQEYLAAIIESSDDAIFASDGTGCITTWNQAAQRLFGYRAEQILGRPATDLVPPEEQPAHERLWHRAAAGELVSRFDAAVVNANGERIPVSLTASPIRGTNGGVIGVATVLRDIRQRRLAELAPLHLAAIVESADDAIASKDLNGIVLSWNPAAERLFGYSAAEMIGQSIRKIIPDDKQSEEDYVLEQVRGGRPVTHFETIRRHKSGSRVDISLTVSPIRDATGRVVGASKIARDIGPRKRAEMATLRLAALVESSDDAIISKDLNGIVTSWNAAAERLFGYTAQEMIGRSITTIIPAARLSEEDHVLRNVRAGIPVDHFDTVRQHKDGSLIDISVTVSPIRDASGTVIGASKIARDIREQKRLREAERIATANAEAARREALEAQNRRIQEASRLKSEFVSNMSHELRTPLNAIIGFAEMMADERFGPLAPKYVEFARLMLASGQHLLQLLNDILDLAKIEAGRIDLRPERVDVLPLVKEVTSVVTGVATQRGLRIVVDVAPDLEAMYLDAGRLKQVLYNYLSNAVKFSHDGGTIEVRVRPEGVDAFRLEVVDYGIGIKPEDQERLFVEFQQIDSSSSKRFPGTGLGLALTRRIVEAQGGTVGVDSRPGVGSTFYATFPRLVAAATAQVGTARTGS